MSILPYLAAISVGGLLLFAASGALAGRLLSKHVNDRMPIVIGGCAFGVWIYVFTQAPTQIALALDVDYEVAPLAIFAGGVAMWLLWLVGLPKKLPLVGRSVISFMLALENWQVVRAKKRIARLERDLKPSESSAPNYRKD